MTEAPSAKYAGRGKHTVLFANRAADYSSGGNLPKKT
jgi:hypothetical protein